MNEQDRIKLVQLLSDEKWFQIFNDLKKVDLPDETLLSLDLSHHY